ncbi:hypothetical protein TcWFU_004730 [Taenia crassiceps]|uniref:Uncharacterized protein n=1 Tax=Taenia crassiceps TaxID=6207 RepID=A0ABR4QQE8_9CEST
MVECSCQSLLPSACSTTIGDSEPGGWSAFTGVAILSPEVLCCIVLRHGDKRGQKSAAKRSSSNISYSSISASASASASASGGGGDGDGIFLSPSRPLALSPSRPLAPRLFSLQFATTH